MIESRHQNMSIRKRPSKKALAGYTYQVYFPYVDSMGVHREYFKGGFKTKKEAQTHEAIKRKEFIDYGDVLENREITFNQVFEEYMDVEGKRKYAKSTYQYYMYTYKKCIRYCIGNRKILTLKYRDIQKFFNGLNDGLSTAKNIKKVFNVTFTYALKNGYIRENPMPLVKLQITPRETENKVVSTITKEQLDEIIRNIIVVDKFTPDFDYTQFNYYSYAVALFIGWYTGLRVSETFGLKKSDFDFENNIIHVQRRLEYHGVSKKKLETTDKMKTKKSKADIPLVSKLKEGLEVWFEKNPYQNVICDIYGNYIHPSAFNYRVRNISLKLGIDFHYHCLRHSFTSNLINNDVKPNVAMELVRHSDIKTTLGVYTHIKESEKSDVLEKVFEEE